MAEPSGDSEGSRSRQATPEVITSPHHGGSGPSQDNSENATLSLTDMYQHPSIASVIGELSAYYKVEACLISLPDEDGQISTAASYVVQSDKECKCQIGHLQDSRLCKMHVKRGAPMIVENMGKSPFKDDPLVVMSQAEAAAHGFPIGGVKFYVEHCLKFPSGRFGGTICIADSSPRETRFSLDEASLLKQKGEELVALLLDFGYDPP